MMNNYNNRDVNKIIVFTDDGTSLNKNKNWFSTDNLIISSDDTGTLVKMPKNGLYCYSPNVSISGDFIVSMDILMPKGNSFLSFGFSEQQDNFFKYKGWWHTSEFKKLDIKRTDGYIKYFLDNEFKEAYQFNSNKIYFQFRLYSPKKDDFEVLFKNFKIILLDYNEVSQGYMLDKLENIDLKLNSLKNSINKLR